MVYSRSECRTVGSKTKPKRRSLLRAWAAGASTRGRLPRRGHLVALAESQPAKRVQIIPLGEAVDGRIIQSNPAGVTK